MSAPPSEPVSPRQASLLAVVVALVALACTFAIDPISRDASHYGRMVLAGVAVLLVAGRGLLFAFGDRLPAARPAFRSLMAATATVGWFNYYQFDREILTGINDHTDTAYYYTNSKYLPELGYYGLYAAALTCDRERGSPRTRDIRQARDLRDYELRPVADILAHGQEVKAGFTPERWAGFCHDITYFLDRLSKKDLASNFFVDHGYNPPPTWTVGGGLLANLAPVEQLKWICLVDVGLVAGMFAVLGWAFGLETALWAMLFFVTTFSGRWPILGMALLRFDWVVMLVVSMALQARGHAFLGGAALAYAALNRIFPVVFFGAWIANALVDTVRERRVLPRHRAFAAGAAATGVLVVGLGLASFGTQTFATAAENLKMHNESYSSHRVGFGDVLVFRGETTREQINANGGIYQKELKIRSMQWGLRGAAMLSSAFILLYAWRVRREDWELLPLLTLPFFCATNAQINYWNLRLVLYAWHGSQVKSPFHQAMLALLFAVEVATQWTKVMAFDRYTTTTTTSIGMLTYFCVLIGWMAWQIARPRPAEPAPAA